MARTKLRALACALALWSAGAAHAAPADLVPPSGAWVKISVAELRARYDVLWAVSDVHGRREELERLLVASRLAVRNGPTITWNGASRRQLLIVAGDLIDGGPDSVGVVLLLERLQREAASSDSGIIVLLGNHEAAFLAYPRSATREFLSSAALHAAELEIPGRITPKRLDASAVGAFMRGLPVVAFVGTWMFAHAGYIDAGKHERELGEFFARLGDTVGRRDRAAFAALLDPQSRRPAGSAGRAVVIEQEGGRPLSQPARIPGVEGHCRGRGGRMPVRARRRLGRAPSTGAISVGALERTQRARLAGCSGSSASC